MLDKKIPRYSLMEESFGQTARSNTKNHDEAIELSVISKKSQRKDTKEIRNQWLGWKMNLSIHYDFTYLPSQQFIVHTFIFLMLLMTIICFSLFLGF